MSRWTHVLDFRSAGAIDLPLQASDMIAGPAGLSNVNSENVTTVLRFGMSWLQETVRNHGLQDALCMMTHPDHSYSD